MTHVYSIYEIVWDIVSIQQMSAMILTVMIEMSDDHDDVDNTIGCDWLDKTCS